MKISISITFLESKSILEKYFYNQHISTFKLENLLFVDVRNKDSYKPDYIFKNVMETFTKDQPICNLLNNTLFELSEMLIFRNNNIYIKNEQFERWQNCILSVSPLLIISYAIHKLSSNSFRIDPKALITNIFKQTTLPSIYEPRLDKIIEDGLNEMHMHLTGTTEPDIVWHDALQRPQEFYKYMKKAFSETSVNEQYLQLGSFEQEDLYRLLKIASQLKDTLLLIMYTNKKQTKEYFTKDNFDISKPLFFISVSHPMELCEKDSNFNSKIQYESLFYIKCFEYIRGTKNQYFGMLLHYYILIYSYFQKLLVQQKNQVGFDQFQKITINQLRELTEEKYNARFHQLQGMYNNSLSILEGRFSPKDNLNDALKLLKDISNGYDKNHKNDFELKLVPHFIKKPDTRNPEKIITFRDLKLRLENKKKLEVLLDTMKFNNQDGQYIFRKLIAGFDAAANELHASPETFSPTYRKLAFLGYNNFTYHAGEDFIHILSGLRMIYESITFLEMKTGNRIGHATAMGIEPELWNQRLKDSKLTIRKGEWLDNLIFAYSFCSENTNMYKYLTLLESSIRKYWNDIYGTQHYYSMYQFIEAWKCRKYDPFIVFGWRDPSFFEDFEFMELKEYQKIEPNIQKLYEFYHTGKYINNYNQMIEIEPLEIFSSKDLRELQNMMIQLLNQNNIAVETLPTSNVRISYYKQYSEHHLFRWLGLADENDPRPNVVVGSDDTGIFMTNLRNEYAHIYQTLLSKSDVETALEKIRYLNETSKSFTFKN